MSVQNSPARYGHRVTRERQGDPVLAVFDLDGTLTLRDTFIPYVLGHLKRNPHRLAGTPFVAWSVAKFSCGLMNNEQLKQAFITHFLSGCLLSELDSWTDQFVARLLRDGCRQSGLETLHGHRQAGDVLVLLSASPDFYVREIGHRLGFDRVICTETSRTADALGDKLLTRNRSGAEKVRCLESLRVEYPGHEIVAYADRLSDVEMLRVADVGVLINGSRRTRLLAERIGIMQKQW